VVIIQISFEYCSDITCTSLEYAAVEDRPIVSGSARVVQRGVEGFFRRLLNGQVDFGAYERHRHCHPLPAHWS